MITLRSVSKSFGTQTLLEDASLQINAGDRYALVGPNGAGKSTLFKMLLGETEPDSGEVDMRRGAQVGYLPQENAPLSDRGVLEETLSNHEDPSGNLTAKAKTVLMGLGFKIADFERAVSTLSGGWAMRVAMARLLIEEPELLLLDEPTNHLDLDSLFWFQDYLQSYPGAIFVISQDRSFINKLCRSVVAIENKTLKVYSGDYEHYVAERAAQRARLESAYRQQQEEIAEMQEFINRNRARASTASRAQSMIKRLEKLERIELPDEGRSVKIRFPQPSRTGVRVLTLKKLSKSYGPVQVYKDLDFELERGWKVAFVGHNGAGKSTLLKVLAGVIPFDGGERALGLNVKVGYFSQHRAETLNLNKTVLEEAMDHDTDLSDQTVRTILGTFLFPGNSVFKKVGVLSGGEKSRLALVKLLLDPPNVLLMDEPTTHLDMASVDALIGALKEFEGTLCCISHDVYFLNALADHVVHVDHGKITVYPGNYDYFLRRQESHRLELEAAAGEGAPPLDPAPKPAQAPRKDPSEERRERARERERQRELETTGKEVTQLLEQIAALTHRMQDPALYNHFAEVKKLADQLQVLQADLQKKEAQLQSLAAPEPS